jgi:hypothetical protein
MSPFLSQDGLINQAALAIAIFVLNPQIINDYLFGLTSTHDVGAS